MMHHLGKKLLFVGGLAAAAFAVKHFWLGSGAPPVTPHGATVKPSGQVVNPPPAVPGGTNPAPPPNPNPTVNTGDVVVDTTDSAAGDSTQSYADATSTGGVDTSSSDANSVLSGAASTLDDMANAAEADSADAVLAGA